VRRLPQFLNKKVSAYPADLGEQPNLGGVVARTRFLDEILHRLGDIGLPLTKRIHQAVIDRRGLTRGRRNFGSRFGRRDAQLRVKPMGRQLNCRPTTADIPALWCANKKCQRKDTRAKIKKASGRYWPDAWIGKSSLVTTSSRNMGSSSSQVGLLCRNVHTPGSELEPAYLSSS